MPRFALRPRPRKPDSRYPPDRAQQPPHKTAFSQRTTTPTTVPSKSNSPTPHSPSPSNNENNSPHNPVPPTSYLVNYDTLPRRNAEGYALSYSTYVPSAYYHPDKTRRRARSNPTQPSTASHRYLDPDSFSRSKSTLAQSPDALISAEIAHLRLLLAEAHRLGDIDVLKDLVGIHEAKLHRQRVDIAKFTSLIREARIITGFSYPRLHDDRTPLIRKVSGRPARQAAGRTVSALKARTASMRTVRVAKAPSAPLTVEHPVVERAAPPLVPTGPVVAEERVKSREPAPPGPLRAKPDMSRLTRKSSARLKRLGSAGSVLIRRLSKVSITEDACSASSGDMPTSSTFDPDTLKRLKVNPKEVITEYIAELNRVENEAEEDVIKLNSAQKLLNDRRVIHCKVMDVLDHFYGSLPGWQEDPISQRMFPETVDMTEAGLQAERDLVEARTLRQRVYAACDDHSHGLKALSHIATNLNRFIRHFEQLVSCLGEYESVVQSDPISKRSNVDITAALLDLEKLLEGCVTSANIATACCVDAPRVSHLQSELKNLRDGFARESIAVMTQGRIYRSDLDGTVQVAKTGLSDCRLAEAFVAERKKMIIADLPTFENQVERCEEYVMHERIGILDIHHSIS